MLYVVAAFAVEAQIEALLLSVAADAQADDLDGLGDDVAQHQRPEQDDNEPRDLNGKLVRHVAPIGETRAAKHGVDEDGRKQHADRPSSLVSGQRSYP